ncbi:efflux RND transporter periplasmic adaptor subunit [Methylocapsa acidiphila]|uniref:efflux RND transporter periplasmic adaptor subunit n=1 Tax=Methylocapsa acidiphila TaxID=133552 RepID=UPI0003FEE77C|nr:efflux RND transporter periplasmic adaptor subunit [Methylocapsa acidiphila]
MNKAPRESSLAQEARPAPRWRRRIFFAVAAAALLGAAFKVYGDYTHVEAVQFYRITPDAAFEVAGPGLLDATNRVVISAQLEGRLTGLQVARNDSVKPGDLLATIDAEEIASQLVSLRADAAAAEEHVAEARSEKTRIDSVVEKAAEDLQRRRSLAARGIASQSDLSAAEAAFQQGKAELERAATSINRALAQAKSSFALRQVMEARYANAAPKSPIAGVVVSREPSVGDLVRPGQKIMEIVDPKSIVVSARFDESVMGQMETGQSAKVRFISEPSAFRDGRVVELHRIVDQETREFAADISVAALPKNWALGQRANVLVEVAHDSRSMLAPISFLARRDGRGGFWFYKDGRAHWGTVAIGYSIGGFVEIVSGLKANDIIVEPEGRYEFERVALAAQPANP